MDLDQQHGSDRDVRPGASNAPSLHPEDIAAFPQPGMAAPTDFAFSPDDRLLTYLWSPDRSLTKHLYALALDTGERRLLALAPDGGTTDEDVSIEEALRRERERQRTLGITHYAWAKRGTRLLIPSRGSVYVQDGLETPLRRVVDGHASPALDPQWSPDGRLIAFVQDDELHVVSVETGERRQITAGARERGVTHGLAEYIAQEEMGRRHGFWWSDDSAWLAFAEVDESAIPIYRILHYGKDTVGPAAQEDHRYPFAGGANARLRLGVVSAQGGAVVWQDVGDRPAEYLARVDWGPDGALYAQLENREQTALELVRFDPATGAVHTVLREHSDVWINLHDLFRPLRDGRFIWASERSGFQHLYLYAAAGTQLRQLTSGDWMVEAMVHVDEAQEIVYLLGTLDSPLERQIYAVSFAADSPATPRRLAEKPGMHAVVVDHQGTRFVDSSQSPESPPAATVRRLADGALLRAVPDEPDPRLSAFGLRPPEFVTLQAENGAVLHGAIYRPPDQFGPGPYPTIIAVYGGPHAQTVSRTWAMTVNMRAQYLRSQGFLVFMLDNRGSARRGLAFEGAIKRRMGSVEVADQVAGVRWLVAQGLADPQRVGVYGWSYGGYMAALCLAKAPDVFHAAVAGAPVTSWDGYDTHYTERYMGLPEQNPQGYAASAVMAHVPALRGRLLLVHGLIDENVHFRHTARLINALIAARKPYELLLFPDERHMPRRLDDRVYMEERIAAFFVEQLRA